MPSRAEIGSPMPRTPKFNDDGYPLNERGNLLNVSHSAMETLARCPRKAYYSYILRIETPGTRASILGVNTHELLEDLCNAGDEWQAVIDAADKPYSQDGRPNELRVLRPAFEHLPWVSYEGLPSWPMPEHWCSEFGILLDIEGLPSPMKAKGFVDLYTFHPIPMLDPSGDPVLLVSDLKTSGNPERYGKGPEQLAGYNQPRMYAAGLVKQLGITPPERIQLHHLYAASKNTPRSYPVVARHTDEERGVPWDVIEAHWRAKIPEAGRELLRLHQLKSPRFARANTRACRDFGGCPYADICPATRQNELNAEYGTPARILTQHGENNTMAQSRPISAARRRLNARLGKKNPPAITPQGASDQLEDAQTRLGTLPPAAQARLQAAQQGQETPKTPAEPSTPSSLSPEAEAVLKAVDEAGTMNYAAISKAFKAASGKRRFFPATAQALADELDGHIHIAGTSDDRNLMFKSKSGGAAAPAPVPPASKPAAPEAAPAPSPDPVTKPAPAPPVEYPSGRIQPGMEVKTEATVYVNCKPSWGEVVTLDELLAPVYAAVEEQHGVAYWGATKFNDGLKAVCEMLARGLAEKGAEAFLDGKALVLDGTHPLAPHVMLLLGRAGVRRWVQ